MTKQQIEFHAKTIATMSAEMEAAEAAGDELTAGMLWDAICFRKRILVKRGVVLV